MKPELTIETHIPYLETLFSSWKEIIGADYTGYRNHVYRMVQFCWAIRTIEGHELSDDDKKKIMIAGVFHDIGIWVADTLDYLEPSVPPAMTYLEDNDLSHWRQDIEHMISEHHKLRKHAESTLDVVELFRQGDLVDFSLGMFKSNLPGEYIVQMKEALPNNGFHKGLLRKGWMWFLRHPFNPAPMMKL